MSIKNLYLVLIHKCMYSVAFYLTFDRKRNSCLQHQLVVLMPRVQDVIINNLLFSISFILQTKLFPSVYLFWKKYKANLLSQLKELGGITIAGDGRHDSMGHCAKYCAYTIFCCTLPRNIHFALVQVHCTLIIGLFNYWITISVKTMLML